MGKWRKGNKEPSLVDGGREEAILFHKAEGQKRSKPKQEMGRDRAMVLENPESWGPQ